MEDKNHIATMLKDFVAGGYIAPVIEVLVDGGQIESAQDFKDVRIEPNGWVTIRLKSGTGRMCSPADGEVVLIG